MRQTMAAEIAALPEVVQMNRFLEQLRAGTCEDRHPSRTLEWAGMTREEALRVLDGALLTSALTVEGRVAALLGKGFFTLGPGGEELINVLGAVARLTDGMALHYRHLEVHVARHLKAGRSPAQIALDRARGHTVSIRDPITGGVFCELGGTPHDHVVTPTLSSQSAPAFGRALGTSLVHALHLPSPVPRDAVQIVTLGDGSVNHGHFLGAVNMAEYCAFRHFKVPIVFTITDNDISISLRGHGWLREQYVKKLLMPVFLAPADDVLELWRVTREAIDYARQHQRPCALIYYGIHRRFGHATTDRQFAYMSPEEIQFKASQNPLEHACARFVALGLITYPEIEQKMRDYLTICEKSFAIASGEPKQTDRAAVEAQNTVPLVPITGAGAMPPLVPSGGGEVMRKHMTRTLDELMSAYPNMVYIGEDVEHGGYYLVTEGLAKKYPNRVHTMPPEENTIIGTGMGFSHVGLLPWVEMPYAKYVDCGMDMLNEAALMCWLTNRHETNGMIIRLQGFGRGLFGGSFHTHNLIPLPPGLDVLCFSNGPDWARGVRFAMKQAGAGRVVLIVDCTNLLNLRHLHGEGDKGWLFPYAPETEVTHWEEVRVMGAGRKLAIVAYGNTVVYALQAQRLIREHLGLDEVAVIDSPLLSAPSSGLKRALSQFSSVVFADDCKIGYNPFSAMIPSLHAEGLLPPKWQLVAAPRTFNVLGSYMGFTGTEDIVEAALKVLGVEFH